MLKVRIKYSIIVLFLCGLMFSFKTKETNQDSLEKTITKVVQAFKEKDASKLNRLISKEKGLIVIFRPGVVDKFRKIDNIDFDNPVPEYLPYFNFSTNYNLRFESLPTFDCTVGWNKEGLFCDSTRFDHLLSITARNLNKYKEVNVSESEIKSFIELEKKSNRIVLSNNEDGELIFYLTLINNNWYLTILDRLTGDCSA